MSNETKRYAKSLNDAMTTTDNFFQTKRSFAAPLAIKHFESLFSLFNNMANTKLPTLLNY